MKSRRKKSRKPYVGPAGNVGPVTELKLRPREDREWAFSLAGTMTAKDAIVEIRNRLGIDLKWDACFWRFIQWQEQEHRLNAYRESIQQRRKFGDLGDSDSTGSCRQGHAALLMEEAVRNGDGKIFIGVARVSLSESRLAQFARKFDLMEQRLNLDRKRLEWEIKKHKDAIAATNPPCSQLSPEEKEAAINHIYGLSEETAERIREANKAKAPPQTAQFVQNGS